MMQSTESQLERDGIWSWARKVATVFMSCDRSCVGLDGDIFRFGLKGPAVLCFGCRESTGGDNGRVWGRNVCRRDTP